MLILIFLLIGKILFVASRQPITNMEAAVILEASMQDVRKNNIVNVVSTYSKCLFYFISIRVNKDADAEDILQDVLSINR